MSEISKEIYEFEWEIILSLIDDWIGCFWEKTNADRKNRVMRIRMKLVKEVDETKDAHI